MEDYEFEGETPGNNGIYINGINYSYLISKSEKDKDKLIIKLYDATNKSNKYYTYSGDITKLKKDIKFLESYENLDDIIICLNDIFNKGNANVNKIEGKYKLQLIYIKSGIIKRSIIQLFENENKHKKYNELEERINKIENDYKNLYNKYEELKIKKENDIRNIIKETIFDNNIQNKLFENLENIFLSKYNLNNISKNKNQNNNKENNIINKVGDIVNIKGNKINQEINVAQKKLNKNINFINDIKSNNNNYIILQVKIDEQDLNKNIRLLIQVNTYKYYFNFEKDDFETIIDNQIVNIKYKNTNGDFKCDEKSKNCELSQKIEHNLNTRYKYYWNFTTTGIHTVKIIFKKKLSQYNYLFSSCKNIYKIDCSNFDCSQVINCSYMFYNCSPLTEINLGKLDFSLTNNFSWMFYGCSNLEKIDVSYFNTTNSKSFRVMFNGCAKLKEINISKFKTTNCEDIYGIFSGCTSLESIDMLNWDIKNINNIEYLFAGCSKLKNIKMNFNNNKKLSSNLVFYWLPTEGKFTYKKGTNCEELLKKLPKNWKITQE